MNDFKVVDLLYKGDVSDIWQGIHVASNTEVHVVTVNKKVNGNIFDQARMLELEPLVSQLNHQHMLKYHKIVQNDNTIGIIMEHPKGGCLRDFLLRRPEKKLSENEARGFFRQIVSAVEYVNGYNVVYRNLNLRNIFIDKNNQIKIGDFLVCTKVGPIYKPSSATSSYHFYAPEIWLEDGRKIDSAVDVWSLGVLLYVMTCGCYPFDGKHEFDIFLSVKRGQFAIPSTLSDECASLIKAILLPEASNRLTIAGIKNHPWFTGGHPSISSLMNNRMNSPNPGLRAMGQLGPISEVDESTHANSPIAPIQQKLQNLNLETVSPLREQMRQPSVPFSQFGDACGVIPFQTAIQTQIEENSRVNEEQQRRKKRPSADEDVQKVIQSYFKLKQEDNVQNVSLFINNAYSNNKMPSNQNFGDFLNNDVSIDKPPTKRRSSDSILASEQVMRLLGVNPPIDEHSNPFASTTPVEQPQQAQSRHTRSNSSGGENKPTKSRVTSSPSTRTRVHGQTSRRRRNSLDTNTFTSAISNNSIPEYDNLFLPLTPTDQKNPPNPGLSSLIITDESSMDRYNNGQHSLLNNLHKQQSKQKAEMEQVNNVNSLFNSTPRQADVTAPSPNAFNGSTPNPQATKSFTDELLGTFLDTNFGDGNDFDVTTLLETEWLNSQVHYG